jgi:hypothetical protein
LVGGLLRGLEIQIGADNLRALADRAILELERCRSGPSALSCK